MRSWRRFRSRKGFNDTGRVCRKPSQINSKNLKDTAHLSSKQHVQKLINSKSCGNLESRTKYRNLTIMVTMPCWNEEGKVGPGVRAVPKSLVDTVCVVDNGSIDGTAQEAKDSGALVISHAKNLGAGGGIRTGLEYGRVNGYDLWPFLQGITKTTQNIFEPFETHDENLDCIRALVG